MFMLRNISYIEVMLHEKKAEILIRRFEKQNYQMFGETTDL